MNGLRKSLKSSHWAIKASIAFGLVVIMGNLLFILYANSALLGQGAAGTHAARPTQQRGAVSLDAAGYEDIFYEHYNKWVIILDRIKYLTEANVPHDNNWKNQLSMQLTQIKLLADTAHKINPPVEHEVGHQKYLMAVDDFSWTADNLVKALLANDKHLTKKCYDKMGQGTSHLKHAMSLIEEGL